MDDLCRTDHLSGKKGKKKHTCSVKTIPIRRLINQTVNVIIYNIAKSIKKKYSTTPY